VANGDSLLAIHFLVTRFQYHRYHHTGLVIEWLLGGYGVAIKGLLSGYYADIGRPLRGWLLSGY